MSVGPGANKPERDFDMWTSDIVGDICDNNFTQEAIRVAAGPVAGEGKWRWMAAPVRERSRATCTPSTRSLATPLTTSWRAVDASNWSTRMTSRALLASRLTLQDVTSPNSIAPRRSPPAAATPRTPALTGNQFPLPQQEYPPAKWPFANPGPIIRERLRERGTFVLPRSVCSATIRRSSRWSVLVERRPWT